MKGKDVSIVKTLLSELPLSKLMLHLDQQLNSYFIKSLTSGLAQKTGTLFIFPSKFLIIKS